MRVINIGKITFFSSLISVLFFTGCSNLSEENSRFPAISTVYTVTGSVSVGRALPSAVANVLQTSSKSARTANSSFSEPESVKFTVTALNVDDILVSADIKKVDGLYQYELELPSGGEWDLTAKMEIGDNIILSGESSIDASESVTIENIVVMPDISEGTGSLKLPVSDESEKINKVKYVAEPLGMMIIDDPEEIQRRHFEGEVQFSGGEADVEINNVPAGCYKFTFSFDDSAGNTLYSCMEAVNVFNGFETDSWVGESAYIKDGVFSVNDALISGYGTEIVKEIPGVVYNYAYSTYSFRTLDEGTSLIDSSKDVWTDKFDLDSDGNVWVFKYGGDTTDATITTSKLTISSPIEVVSMEMKRYYGLFIDRSSNDVLYTYFIRDDTPSLLELHRYPSIVAEGDTSSTDYTVEFDSPDGFTHKIMTIHGDNIYDIGFTSSSSFGVTSYDYYLILSNLSDVIDNTISSGTMLSLNLDTLLPGHSSSIQFTDMLYQDGNLYILVNDNVSYPDGNNSYSRGAVLKFNCFSKTIVGVAGWTEGKTCVPAKTGARGASTTLLYEVPEGADLTDKSVGTPIIREFSSGAMYNFYAPYDNVSSYFTGPQKFIAIKPKKLVIADSGIAFYTDENDRALKYKEVNRVVYVDLQSLSILESETKDLSTEFTGSYPGLGSTNFFSSTSERLDSYYTWNTSGRYDKVTTSGQQSVYGAFIKGE